MKKRICIIAMVFVFCLSLSVGVYAEEQEKPVNLPSPVLSEESINGLPFTDVQEDAWYYSCVQHLFNNKIINGISVTKFAPDQNISRAEFVKMISKTAKADLASSNGETLFTDVPSDAWFAKDVQWATNNGILYGRSETLFAPEANITREEACAILYRFMQSNGNSSQPKDGYTFSDDKLISDWAKDSVYALRIVGIINGYNGDFKPQDNMRRSEVSKIFSVYLHNIGYGEKTEAVLQEGDILLYEAEEITDLDTLYEMAVSEESTTSQVVDSGSDITIIKSANLTRKGDDEAALSSNNEIPSTEIPSYEVTQHLRTIQRDDGTIEKEYTTTLVSQLDNSNLDSSDVDPMPQSGYTDKEGTSYSVRSYVKMDYLYIYSPTFHYFQIAYAKGAWRILDENVWTPGRKLFATTEGFLLNAKKEEQRLGPYTPSPEITGYSREVNLKNISVRVNNEAIFGGRCATVTDVKRGSSLWTFTVKVGMGNIPT